MSNNKYENTGEYYLKKTKTLLNKKNDSDVSSVMLNRLQLKQQRVQDLIRQLRQNQQVNRIDRSEKQKQLGKLSKFVLDKNNGIKYYIKQKYQSGFFKQYITDEQNNEAQKNLNKQISLFKQNLIQQQIQKRKKKQQIIAYIKNFQEHKTNLLPISQINNQCFRYPDYLDIDTKCFQVKSSTTEVQSHSLPLQQLKIYRKVDQSKIIKLDTINEIQQQFESEQELNRLQEQRRVAKITKMLSTNKKIYKIFSQFFKSIIKQQQGIKQQIKNKIVNISDKKIIGVKYHEDNKPSQIKQKNIRQSNRPQQYQPVPYIIPASYIPKDDLIFQTQKIANKRNGDTNLFHPKSFLLNGQTLFYHDTNDQVFKKITIYVQKLELIEIQKQIGGFFSRQKKNTKIFFIKGRQRSLQIQYSQREGSDLFKQLVEYMSIKAYCNFCIFTGISQNRFGKYIYDENTNILDFSQIGHYESKKMNMLEFCEYFQIWMNVLKYRKQIKNLVLRNSNLDQKIVQDLLKKVIESQSVLKQIQIDGNNLTLQSVKLYSVCLQKYTSITVLNLQNCNLNDQVFKQGLKDLPLYANRLKLLNLSNNKLTNIAGYFLTSLLKKINNIYFKFNKLQFSPGVLLQFLNQKYTIIGLQMDQNKIILDNDLLISIAQKLSVNRNLKKLSLLSNQCQADIDVLKNLFKYANYIEQISFDLPIQFMYEYDDDQNINQWGIYGNFIKNQP